MFGLNDRQREHLSSGARFKRQIFLEVFLEQKVLVIMIFDKIYKII